MKTISGYGIFCKFTSEVTPQMITDVLHRAGLTVYHDRSYLSRLNGFDSEDEEDLYNADTFSVQVNGDWYIGYGQCTNSPRGGWTQGLTKDIITKMESVWTELKPYSVVRDCDRPPLGLHCYHF